MPTCLVLPYGIIKNIFFLFKKRVQIRFLNFQTFVILNTLNGQCENNGNLNQIADVQNG